MKMSQRSFLMLGLLTAIGFNLSWNPEHFFISRNEIKNYGVMQEIQLASELAAPGKVEKIDLGEFGANGKNVDLNFTVIDVNGAKVVSYYFSGKNGEILQGLGNVGTTPLTAENSANLDILKRVLAMKGLEEIDKSKSVEGADVPPRSGRPPQARPARPAKPKLEDPCKGQEFYDDKLSCQQDVLTEMVDSCNLQDSAEDDSRSRRRVEQKESGNSNQGACIKKTEDYFNLFVKKSFKALLAVGASAEDRESAMNIRDDLLINLPPAFNGSIRQDLISISANGVLARAEERYMEVMQQTNNETSATLAAKRKITEELYSQRGDGAQLCSVMTGASVSACAQASQNQSARMMLERQNPAYQTYVTSYESKLGALTSLQQNQSSFLTSLRGEFGSGQSVTNSNITPEMITARSQGGRESVSPVPGNGSGPAQLGVNNGMQAPTGSISIPGAGTPTLQGTQGAGQMMPMQGQPQPYANQQMMNQQMMNQQINPMMNQQMMVPGQVYNPQAQPTMFNQQGQMPYSSMSPVNPTGPNVGNYPLSPGQAGGRF